MAKYSLVMTHRPFAFGKFLNNKRTVWLVLYSGFARFALLLHASYFHFVAVFRCIWGAANANAFTDLLMLDEGHSTRQERWKCQGGMFV